MEDLPLFAQVSRRALLRRGAVMTGALVAGTMLAACGNDDESALSEPTGSTSSTATSPSSAAGAPSASASAPAVDVAPTTGSHPVTMSFSYAASDSSGRVKNPYIAVWIEDEASTMVGLVSVWYQARESKYLRELTEYSGAVTDVSSSAVDAVSGATRTPGDYSVQWDGTGLDGSQLSGTYTLWIEAAREHGPHSVASGPVTLGQSGTVTVTGSGELSDVTAAIA